MVRVVNTPPSVFCAHTSQILFGRFSFLSTSIQARSMTSSLKYVHQLYKLTALGKKTVVVIEVYYGLVDNVLLKRLSTIVSLQIVKLQNYKIYLY